MKKKRILAVGVIALLLIAGLILIGCGRECIGTGECTITIKQGATGLSIDYDSPRSDCGNSAKWDSDLGKYTGGCQVTNMNSSWYQTSSMRAGTHGCNCKNSF